VEWGEVNVMGWVGVGWVGVEWDGVGWGGVGWGWVGWVGIFRSSQRFIRKSNKSIIQTCWKSHRIDFHREINSVGFSRLHLVSCFANSANQSIYYYTCHHMSVQSLPKVSPWLSHCIAAVCLICTGVLGGACVRLWAWLMLCVAVQSFLHPLVSHAADSI